MTQTRDSRFEINQSRISNLESPASDSPSPPRSPTMAEEASPMSNGHPSSSARRDHELPATVPGVKALGPARSGRRFVLGAIAAILVIWGTLFFVFRDW